MSRSSTWVRGGILACLLSQLAAARPPEARPLHVPADGAGAGEGTSAPAAGPELTPAGPPARAFGRLDATECVRRLALTDVPYEPLERLRAVDAPVRLAGPVGGVTFAGTWARAGRAAPPEPLDCRLALALGELAALVAAHDVVRVVHYGIYRGDVPWPRRGPPLHHLAGLAIDVAAFVKADGTRLDVRSDWIRGPSSRTCRGDDPPETAPRRAAELHAILCEIAGRAVFHEVLTPNHDARHRDHFHLEVVRQADWTLVR